MRLIEAHDAIYERITEALEGIASAWDYLPKTEKPPFVVVGRMDFDFSNSLATKTSVGYTVTQKMHVVTTAREKHKAVEILRKTKEALAYPLVVEGTTVLRQNVTTGLVEETADEEFYGEMNLLLWLEDD